MILKNWGQGGPGPQGLLDPQVEVQSPRLIPTRKIAPLQVFLSVVQELLFLSKLSEVLTTAKFQHTIVHKISFLTTDYVLYAAHGQVNKSAVLIWPNGKFVLFHPFVHPVGPHLHQPSPPSPPPRTAYMQPQDFACVLSILGVSLKERPHRTSW